MVSNKQKKGKQGEQIARVYLTKKGYTIRQKNYRFKRYEIDIIAEREQLLVFVEVKFHENTGFGLPEEAVSDAQQDQIIEAAEQYILDTDWQGDIRFDIIAIETHTENAVKIQHFEDAFY